MKTPNLFRIRIKKYPELQYLPTLCMKNPVVAYSNLIDLKEKIPKDIYAFYLRYLFKINTHNVPTSVLLSAFNGVKKKSLMDRRELRKLRKLSDNITIFRGTDGYENESRLSWTLDENIARKFCTGQLFKAIISKKEIIAYFLNDSNENEIVVYLNKNYTKIH